MSENNTPLDVSDIVEQYYEMNPETDEVFHSDMLQYGMRVLVEDTESRESLEKMALLERLGIPLDNTNMSRIRKANRWCTVSHMRLMGDTVTFIGTYDDGVKCLRTAPVTAAWLVKRDSIPVETDAEAEIWSKISTIMVEVAMIDRRFTDSERDRVTAQVGHYVDKAMEIFAANVDVFVEDMEAGGDPEGYSPGPWSEWKNRIPIQAPEYLMDHHPDPNPTKITGESYDELVAKMTEAERAKQAQYLKDRARFAEIHADSSTKPGTWSDWEDTLKGQKKED